MILDGVSGDKVSIHYLGFLNENIQVFAMISCRFWLYMGPVVATFYLTNFLATDRKLYHKELAVLYCNKAFMLIKHAQAIRNEVQVRKD